ncbi:PhzF family phenazine biosynthesis protein [Marinobacter confluentis]|uniref:PhzF family phenazine biosynthesis protein n=1 Tax=Marinobacter confluentis TaxID=1697557 RepID=A0A4Z1C883_9GAMM|nr:PhzF family phenazine biosynthesis protein [Marinobacter confluentis]TGN39128.1 PhzF family phenazine biosynthesis protein [Marinobacter confluentis]
MELKIVFVDAFTDTIFGGNPAAVVITDEWLSEDLMQSIATENNLSETAFLVKVDAATYHIRWFSPLTEIAFCGHATLASAFVLFDRDPGETTIKFWAKAVGLLSVEKTESGRIQMDFPNTKPDKVEKIPDELVSGLSIPPVDVYRNSQAYFVIYQSESEVLSVQRNNELLKQLKPLDVVVTCRSETEKYDFISRYFWPANGGDEDPVTGSIHTGLAPLWAEWLGKTSLVAHQASKRGGVLYCSVSDTRVTISGDAVRYLSGTIRVQ